MNNPDGDHGMGFAAPTSMQFESGSATVHPVSEAQECARP